MEQPIKIYCHPYEFNGGELSEYQRKVPRRFLLQQQLGRHAFVKRVRRLLTRLPFGRFDEVVTEWTGR